MDNFTKQTACWCQLNRSSGGVSFCNWYNEQNWWFPQHRIKVPKNLLDISTDSIKNEWFFQENSDGCAATFITFGAFSLEPPCWPLCTGFRWTKSTVAESFAHEPHWIRKCKCPFVIQCRWRDWYGRYCTGFAWITHHKKTSGSARLVPVIMGQRELPTSATSCRKTGCVLVLRI